MSPVRRGIGLSLVALCASLSCSSEGRLTQAAVAAARLVVARQPSGALSGVRFATPPVVEVRDAGDRLAPEFEVAVTAEIATGSGVLAGTMTVDAVQGVATFDDLIVNGVGPHTLRFTSRGLAEATTASVTISAPTTVASQIVITQQPATSVSGINFPIRPVVELRDSSSNLVAAATAVVTAELASGTGILVGTNIVPTQDGIATFPDLRINGTGSHTLIFTAAELQSATSASIDVAQTPSLLVMETQPGGATTGSAMSIQPTVRIIDNAGLLVSGATLPVTASISSGGGVLLGTTTINAVGGIATFTNLRIDGSGNHVLRFSATTPNPVVTSSTFSVAIGPPARLTIGTQPVGGLSASPLTTQSVVHVRDAGNQLVTATVPVTAALASGAGVLSGSLTVSAVNGVATFTDLVITGSGSHSLLFTAAGLTAVVSSSFTVLATPPPPQRLAVLIQPSGPLSGFAFATQPTVQVRDSSNNLVEGATNPVTASISGGGGTLSGTTTVAAVNGVATFTNLSIVGEGVHSLSFSSTGLLSATSAPMVVASRLAVATHPSGAVTGANFTTQPVVQLRDENSNVALGTSASVIASIATGAGTLSGTTMVTAVNGTATFTNLRITGSGSHTLQFTSPGLTSATTTTFNVLGGPTQLALLTQPSSASTSGAPLAQQPVLQLRDATNQPVSLAGVLVTTTIASGGGTLGGTVTVLTNAAGRATFTDLSVSGTAGDRTLRFDAPTLTGVTSNTIAVADAPPSSILFQDSFESGDFSHTENGVSWVSAPNVTVASAIANTGTRSARYSQGVPLGDGNWAELRFGGLPNVAEVFIQFRLYYPAGTEIPSVGPRVITTGTANDKFFRLWGGDNAGYGAFPGNKVGASTWGNGTGADANINVEFEHSPAGGPQWGMGEGPSAPARAAFLSNENRGRWLRIRIRTRVASSANNDGVVQIWLDNTLIRDRTTLQTYPYGIGPNGYTHGYLLGYSNNAYQPNQVTYLDDVVISTGGFPVP